MATGGTDNGEPVTDSQTIFFQQVALNLEAKSNKFSASAYALVPVGEHGAGTGKVAIINSGFMADNLSAYGLDIGYNIKPNLNLALGTYYQLDEKEEMRAATGFGVKTGLTCDITNELQAGIIYSYDENFESRITGNLKWRFGNGGTPKGVRDSDGARRVRHRLPLCRGGSRWRPLHSYQRPRQRTCATCPSHSGH